MDFETADRFKLASHVAAAVLAELTASMRAQDCADDPISADYLEAVMEQMEGWDA